MQASADDVNNDDDEQSIVLTRQVDYELGPGNIVNNAVDAVMMIKVCEIRAAWEAEPG